MKPAPITGDRRMNKTELVAELARRTELTQKDASAAID
jgi:nucleoid DNA-binding protein